MNFNVFYSLMFYWIHKPCLTFYIVILTNLCNVSLFFFTSLPDGKYSNLLIVATFSNKSFSSKKSSLVKNSYLPTFTDDKAEILDVCLSKSYWTLLCSVLLPIVSFSLEQSFYNRLSLNINGLLHGKVLSFSKNENDFLKYKLCKAL